MEGSTLVFYVNGKQIIEANPEPETTLLHYLRTKLRLTGSKLGCGEGGCGACTVMVSRYLPTTDAIVHYSLNACLAPLCSLHGLSVTTVEGIGSTRTRLHPVQEVLAKAHGSQCGFCTPGIVMSMYTLLRNNPRPSREQIEDNFDGNLCRCTGYRPILQGFHKFSKEVCGLGEACCRARSEDCTTEKEQEKTSSPATPPLYDPSQEPIFPPELKTKWQTYISSLTFKSRGVRWYRPVTLEELYELKDRHPHAKLVVGNTEIGVEMKLKKMEYPVLIAATHIDELNNIETSDSGITLGASVTLAVIRNTLNKMVRDLPEHQTRSFQMFLEMIPWFGGTQLRNVLSIGGNIMTASPISDLIPLLMASRALLKLGSKGQRAREVTLDGDFLTGYRKTATKPNEILLSVTLPFSSKEEFFLGFKQSHRKEDDIAIVNAGMRVAFHAGTSVVKDATLAYGGMAPTTVLAASTMQGLVERKWDDSLLETACTLLADDLPLAAGSPGGMVEYRRTLTTSFFFKFFTYVRHRLDKDKYPYPDDVVSSIRREVSEGVQVFEEVPRDQDPDDDAGRPLVHMSALQQTTGEAMYVDDLPLVAGELYAAMVISKKSHAKLVSIDATEALSMQGVVDFVSCKDVPGATKFGVVVLDEEIFASEKVVYEGQVIGCIVGESQAEAQKAARRVKVEYEPLQPIITIEEAIKADSYFDPPLCVSNGDIDLGFQESDHVIEREIRIGAQEHFYLETHVVAARPTNEDGGMEIIANTQFPSEIQHQVAAALGVLANKVVCRIKRIGGGFGGKESQSSLITLPVAVAAAKLNRPVRCMLDRDEDMIISGGRHAFLARYKVGFATSGKIKALDLQLYSNAGSSLDLSNAVMTRAVYTSDNAYNIANIRVRGHVCRTNLPSATAFRGFGSPQAMMVPESIADTIAQMLNMESHQVRHMNLYHEGDLTYFGQKVENANIQKMWNQCVEQADLHQRHETINQFNKTHRWKKRDISIIPTKYALSFPKSTNFLNQACALVTLYMDGSVLVSHCGVEIGQGLHTKMIQVASRALGVSSTQVHINDTSTDKIHKAGPTAGSMGSDLNGGAVKNACETLRKRLEPYKTANPNGSLKDWVNAAYIERVHLSAAGHYRLEGLDHDPVTNKGNMFSYFTCGVACSEVEIDCLTGDHQVLRTDIVMDVGKSLNPAIDIGQIEGGFMQGYGLYVLEQHKVTPSGSILTRGPGAYKIPGFRNIPVTMNVTLLKESGNEKAVYSSKGIGEPPLFLASSVFFAIKDAIRSARKDAGCSTDFQLDSPATPERIRMTCQDDFTKQFPSPEKGSYRPWFVDL